MQRASLSVALRVVFVLAFACFTKRSVSGIEPPSHSGSKGDVLDLEGWTDALLSDKGDGKLGSSNEVTRKSGAVAEMDLSQEQDSGAVAKALPKSPPEAPVAIAVREPAPPSSPWPEAEEESFPAPARRAVVRASPREEAPIAAESPEGTERRILAEAQVRGLATQTTLKERARQLLAQLRGDSSEPLPPGAAIQASPLAFAVPSPARAPSPAALSALGAGGPESRLAGGPMRQAVSKYQIGDYPGAETLLTKRLEENPSDARALRYRAVVRRQMRSYEPSAEDARRILALSPSDSFIRRLLIDDLVDLGRSDEALQTADRGLAQPPRNAALLAGRSRVWESLGRPDRALDDLKEAAQLDAQFESAYRQAQSRVSGPETPLKPRSGVVWLGAVGTALLFFSFVLFRKRGETSSRLALRVEDQNLLARGMRPDAAPQGFQILRTLGQGGMGVVYEAMDVALRRPVAIKKMRAEVADNARERARFLKEARTVAALKHPNIVAIHSIHEDESGLFLVFEKVSGETLHERLGRGPLPPGEAVVVLRQVATALDYAHSQGVVHQDLKPANVMVSGTQAMVMDFGIARRVAETLSTLSRIEVAGTPAYMAPEQELGGSAGPAADLFSLGVCAYELLSGRPPFPGGGMMMKTQKIFRPVSEVAPGLPRAADAVIARALEPEPVARWPSAASFTEALARSLS